MTTAVHMRSRDRIIVVGLTALLLLLPALYNGFPLLFPDTDDYLKVSYGHFWTLDRSGFYGLLFKPILLPTSGLTGIWLAAVLQVTIIAALLFAVARRVAPAAKPLALIAAITVTCLLSSLPWHAAQLIPDAFTGVLVLTVWLAASRESGAPGTALIWLAAAVLGLMHYTHIGLMAVAMIVAVIFAALSGVRRGELGRRLAFGAIAIASVVGAHVSANGLLFHRWTISPTGSWFLFARVNEDGLVPLWLDRHCGRDAPKDLCDIRRELPRDSQVLLWSGTSPLHKHVHEKIGRPEFWHWMDMLGTAAKGSIEERPMMFAAAATRGAARQFVHFNALDDLCPETCATPTLRWYRPDVSPALDNSRQLRSTMPKPLIRAVTNTAETVSLLLMIALFVLAVRRRDHLAQSFLATIAACLIANAYLGAGLSAVNDRYQSRVVWLATFSVALVGLRLLGSAQSRSTSNGRAILRDSQSSQVPDQR